MIDGKTHPCIRCGVTVRVAVEACRDCYDTDLPLIKAWRKPVLRLPTRINRTPAKPGAPIVHGTERGYRLHIKRGEIACFPCKAGKAQAQRERKNRPNTYSIGAAA